MQGILQVDLIAVNRRSTKKERNKQEKKKRICDFSPKVENIPQHMLVEWKVV